MKLKTWQIDIALALTVGATLQVEAAQASNTETIVRADNKAEFSAVAAAVQKEMRPGGRYEFVDNKERDAIDTRLVDMQSLFDRHDTVARMDMNTKVQLFNDQETVNGILTRRDDDRLVCERDAPLGSLIPRTTCLTYREAEQRRRSDLHYLDTLRQLPNPNMGAGGL
jgi:hypothetical protein